MTKHKKKGAGGKREGAGNKSVYGEKTEPYSFRCPVSKLCQMQEIIKEQLKQWEIKK